MAKNSHCNITLSVQARRVVDSAVCIMTKAMFLAPLHPHALFLNRLSSSFYYLAQTEGELASGILTRNHFIRNFSSFVQKALI